MWSAVCAAPLPAGRVQKELSQPRLSRLCMQSRERSCFAAFVFTTRLLSAQPLRSVCWVLVCSLGARTPFSRPVAVHCQCSDSGLEPLLVDQPRNLDVPTPGVSGPVCSVAARSFPTSKARTKESPAAATRGPGTGNRGRAKQRHFSHSGLEDRRCLFSTSTLRTEATESPPATRDLDCSEVARSAIVFHAKCSLRASSGTDRRTETPVDCRSSASESQDHDVSAAESSWVVEHCWRGSEVFCEVVFMELPDGQWGRRRSRRGNISTQGGNGHSRGRKGRSRGKAKGRGRPRLSRLDPSMHSKLNADASVEWADGEALFNAIVLLKGESQSGRFLIKATDIVISQ